MLYGPFKIDNKHISQTNDLLDSSLKIKNQSWGVRDLGEVSKEANKYGFIKEELYGSKRRLRNLREKEIEIIYWAKNFKVIT